MKINRLIIMSCIILSGCSNDNIHSFNDFIDYDINDIKSVGYRVSNEPFEKTFEGDYASFFDINYIEVDKDRDLGANIKSYRFYIEFNDSVIDDNFVYYDNYLYYEGEECFYRSEQSIEFNEHTKVKSIMMKASYDYGSFDDNKASLLIEGSTLFFDPSDYGISSIYGGDVLNVYYTGEIYILESYPSQVSINLVWVELLEASIIEFEVLEVPNETRKELVAKDPTYQIASVNTDKVIDEDYNFKSFEELDAGSVVYGTLIPGVNCLCVESLFSFNPR